MTLAEVGGLVYFTRCHLLGTPATLHQDISLYLQLPVWTGVVKVEEGEDVSGLYKRVLHPGICRNEEIEVDMSWYVTQGLHSSTMCDRNIRKMVKIGTELIKFGTELVKI